MQIESCLPPLSDVLTDTIPNISNTQNPLSPATKSTDPAANETVSSPESPSQCSGSLPRSLVPQQSPKTNVVVVKEGRVSYQPKVQTTRAGRVTKIPAKFMT